MQSVPVFPSGAPSDTTLAAASNIVAQMLSGAPAAQPTTPAALPEIPAPAASVVQTPPPSPQPQVQTPAPAPTPAARYGEQTAQPDLTIPDIPAERTDIQMPTDANDASAVGRAFAASRAEARQYRQLAHDLRNRLTQAFGARDEFVQKQDELTKQLTEAQAQNKALEDEIGRMDLRRSPDFIQKYDQPVLAIRDGLADEFHKHGVAPDDAVALATRVLDANSSDDVPELVASLPPAVQGMAMYKYSEADRIIADREQALSSWRETQAGLDQVSRRESPVLAAQHREALCNTGFERVSRVVKFWDDPAFAAYRDKESANIKSWFQQAPEDQVVAAAVEGALVAPFAYEQIGKLQQEVARLSQALESRTRLAAPTVSPYYSSVPVPPPPAPPPKGPTQADADDPIGYATRLIRGSAEATGMIPFAR